MLFYAEVSHSLTHLAVSDICKNGKAEESWIELSYIKCYGWKCRTKSWKLKRWARTRSHDILPLCEIITMLGKWEIKWDFLLGKFFSSTIREGEMGKFLGREPIGTVGRWSRCRKSLRRRILESVWENLAGRIEKT